MLTGFNFLVYTVEDGKVDTFFAALQKLGFCCCNTHANKIVTFWYQHKFLIQVQVSTETKFTGFGLIYENLDIDHDIDLTRDLFTGWYKTVDPNGLEFYILDSSEIEEVLTKAYLPFEEPVTKGMGLISPSGILLNLPVTPEISKFYKKLGFIKINNGKLTRFVPPDKRFILYMGEKNINNYVLFVDCIDVFTALSKLTVAGFEQVPTNQKIGEAKIGNRISQLTAAYQATAFGNENSYSIEKIIKEPLPGIDIVARERFQKLHITEKNIDFLYDIKDK